MDHISTSVSERTRYLARSVIPFLHRFHQKSSMLVGPGRPPRPVPTAVAITLLAIILPNPKPNQFRVKNCRTLPNRTKHEHSVWLTALGGTKIVQFSIFIQQLIDDAHGCVMCILETEILTSQTNLPPHSPQNRDGPWWEVSRLAVCQRVYCQRQIRSARNYRYSKGLWLEAGWLAFCQNNARSAAGKMKATTTENIVGVLNLSVRDFQIPFEML